MDNNNDNKGSRKGGGRGFAGMSVEKRKKIAAKGGRASHRGRSKSTDLGSDSDTDSY
jgi:general stress protein YciG